MEMNSDDTFSRYLILRLHISFHISQLGSSHIDLIMSKSYPYIYNPKEVVAFLGFVSRYIQ